MRVEFGDGTEALTPADVQALLQTSKNGTRVRLADVVNLLGRDHSVRVYSSLVNGDVASRDSTIDATSSTVVTLLLRHPSSLELAQESVRQRPQYPIEYIYPADGQAAQLEPWQRDSRSAAFKELVEAFLQKPGVDAAPQPANTTQQITPLRTISRFLKAMVPSPTDIETAMNVAEKRIESRRRRRAKKAEAAAAAAAAGPATAPSAATQATIDEAKLDELRKALEERVAAPASELESMGFAPLASRRALLENALTIDLAINFLLSTADPAALDTPLSPADVQRFAAKYVPALTAPPGSQRGLGGAGAADGGGGVSDDASDNDAADPARLLANPFVAQLVEMGFDAVQADRALRECRGNFEVATEALLEGRTFPDPPPTAKHWLARLQDRLVELAEEAEKSDPPRAATVTPKNVVEVTQRLLWTDRTDEVRRTEPGISVLREIAPFFPAPQEAPPPSTGEAIVIDNPFAADFNFGDVRESPEALLAALRDAMARITNDAAGNAGTGGGEPEAAGPAAAPTGYGDTSDEEEGPHTEHITDDDDDY
jgi:hypothetical protein